MKNEENKEKTTHMVWDCLIMRNNMKIYVLVHVDLQMRIKYNRSNYSVGQDHAF